MTGFDMYAICKSVSEEIKSILTKAGVRVALKPVCTLAIYSVYQKQDHQRREPKPLYTNLNVEHARSPISANPNGVGVMVFKMAGT